MLGSDLTATAAPGIIAVDVGPAPGDARSCRTAHPCRSSGPSSRAALPRRPRRQALASGLGSPWPDTCWTPPWPRRAPRCASR